MAKQKEGVYQRILECAKKEFLEKGFKDASLRNIAQEAGTSTSSIYTRFQDKEGLFDAIVLPVMQEFEQYFISAQETFQQYNGEEQDQYKYDYTSNCMQDLMDYIYSHFQEFKILLECSYGTASSDFIERLTHVEVRYTVKFMEAIHSDALASGRVTEDFLHIVTKAYLTGMFEVVLHDMKKEDASKYIEQLRIFYCAGHETIYHPEKIPLLKL